MLARRNVDPYLISSLVEIVVHWSWGDIPFSKGFGIGWAFLTCWKGVIEVCFAQLTRQVLLPGCATNNPTAR